MNAARILIYGSESVARLWLVPAPGTIADAPGLHPGGVVLKAAFPSMLRAKSTKVNEPVKAFEFSDEDFAKLRELMADERASRDKQKAEDKRLIQSLVDEANAVGFMLLHAIDDNERTDALRRLDDARDALRRPYPKTSLLQELVQRAIERAKMMIASGSKEDGCIHYAMYEISTACSDFALKPGHQRGHISDLVAEAIRARTTRGAPRKGGRGYSVIMNDLFVALGIPAGISDKGSREAASKVISRKKSKRR